MNKKRLTVLALFLLILLICISLIELCQNKSKPYEEQLKNIIMSAFENNGSNNEYPLLISDHMYWRISNNIDGGYDEEVKFKKLDVDVGFIKWFKKTSTVKVYLEFEAYDDKKHVIRAMSGNCTFKVEIKKSELKVLHVESIVP